MVLVKLGGLVRKELVELGQEGLLGLGGQGWSINEGLMVNWMVWSAWLLGVV